ncbi:MAG TPA: GIY-YIG nuclease family protein, partial [Spirochaetota bacterium]
MPAPNQIVEDKLKTLTSEPGVYLMKDADGLIIYVGKAKALKRRVSSYFQKTDHDPKTASLVSQIVDFEYIVTDNEIEALLLENSLIKKHMPKYNIRLKDDKRYPYIAVTTSEDYPRVIYTRSLRKNGDRYFGPYTDSLAARSTVELINRIFHLRTCNKKLPLKEGERPCLNFQMKRCSGVCVGEISAEDYRTLVQNAILFLEGNVDPVLE